MSISTAVYIIVALLALIDLSLTIILARIKNQEIEKNMEKIHSNKYTNQEIKEMNQEIRELNKINPFTAPALLIYDCA